MTKERIFNTEKEAKKYFEKQKKMSEKDVFVQLIKEYPSGKYKVRKLKRVI